MCKIICENSGETIFEGTFEECEKCLAAFVKYGIRSDKFYIEDEQGGYKFATEYKTGISYYLINNENIYIEKLTKSLLNEIRLF